VRAFDAGASRAEPWLDAKTVAFGITVPAPLGDELILTALADTKGTAVAVDDDEILAELRAYAKLEGLLLCPEGAACLAGLRHLRSDGWLGGTERVVFLNTGAGVKYPDTVPVDDLEILPIGATLPMTI
jgi:threonine synthase